MLLLTVALIALPFSIAAARVLGSVFPRHRGWGWGALALGNALVLAGLVQLAGWYDGYIVTRALLAPAFILWQLFALLYVLLSVAGAVLYFSARQLGWFRAGWTRFWRTPTLILLSCTALLLVVGLYGALVPLEVREVPIGKARLPAAFDGYRIALLSDLHVGLLTRERRMRQIANAVNRARPDMVLVAGDLVDDQPRFVSKAARALGWMRAPDGVFFVLGNHEMYERAADSIVGRDDLPFRVLVNRAARITRGREALALAGLGEPHAYRADLEPDWARALEGTRPGDFVVAAAHRPHAFAEASRRGVPLTLAGHSHGGQLGSRRLGWNLAAPFLEWHMGRYERGASTLYVTTGAGYWVLPLRVGLTPEMVVLELRRTDVP